MILLSIYMLEHILCVYCLWELGMGSWGMGWRGPARMCVCVCVCERERERETDRQTEAEYKCMPVKQKAVPSQEVKYTSFHTVYSQQV